MFCSGISYDSICLVNHHFFCISGHYASDEVKEKIAFLTEEKTNLQSLWEERRIMYEQCMDYQLFYRDMEQADAWMSKQESFLDSEDYGDSLDSVEAMTKKQEDFEKSLLAQEEKIKALDEFASKLIEVDHYAKDGKIFFKWFDFSQTLQLYEFSYVLNSYQPK